MHFQMTSTVIQPDKNFPLWCTCDGRDASPPFDWIHAPEGTKSFALILEDPDAPHGTFDHWIIWNIPGETFGIMEDVPPADILPHNTRQGTNSFGKVGYSGPCPSAGETHNYVFTLYALDIEEVDLPQGIIKRQLLKAINDHILGSTTLTAPYRRENNS